MTQSQTRRKFLQDMELRGFSAQSIITYENHCKRFLDFTKVEDTTTLTEREFRTYLLHLSQREDLAPATINLSNSVVRFLYEVTLEKDINHRRVPRKKNPLTRPMVLDPRELGIFFAHLSGIKHFAFFLNLYGSGLRIGEMLALRTDDIDAQRMLLRVRCGKGNKERYAPLTEAGLEAFRHYWKLHRPVNADNYVFPDRTRTRTMTRGAFESSFKKILALGGICKRVSPHVLRHCYATHSLQSGTDLVTLKETLGHSCFSSTATYVHLSLVDRSNSRSPEELTAEFWAGYRERNFIHG